MLVSERTGGRQTAQGRGRKPRIVDQGEGTGHRTGAGIDRRIARPGPAGLVEDPGILLVLGAPDEVPLTQVPATGNPKSIGACIAAAGLSDLGLGLQAAELGVEHKVDHAGHGVRAIDGRSAARDDVDPLDQHLRNRVGIDLTIERGWRRAPAIDKDQGANGPKVAQIQKTAAEHAGRSAAAAADRVGAARAGRRPRELRKLVQPI